MPKGLIINILSGFMLVCTLGCRNDSKLVEKPSQKELDAKMIQMNREAVKIESDRIDAYVKRRKYQVTKTGTGVRYLIYKHGNDSLDLAKEKEVALVDYTISLLNGDEVYSTKESGPKEFLIGMDDVESGLHEGITYMRPGDKAIIIIPSHRAHGLAGDLEKIPMRSTIIYDITLLSLLR